MQNNTQKITKELCLKNDLIFLPETKEDAELIQKKLLLMGFNWIHGSQTVGYISESLQWGIVLQNSKICYRSEKDKTDYLICTLSHFDQSDEPLLTREEQISLMKQFNALSAVVLQMSETVRQTAEKVDALCAEVMPKRIEKPFLKKPE